MRRRENKSKKIKVFVGILISILMVSSIGSVILFYGNSGSDKTTLTFSGKKYMFTQIKDSQGNTYYDVSSGQNKFTSYFLPSNLRTIPLLNNSIAIIKNSNYFYVTFNPGESDIRYVDLLRIELKNNIPAEKFFQDAVTNESSLYALPIISCENSTISSPVILLKNSTSSRIYDDKGCVIVEYLPQDVAKIRDILVYLMQGVDI